MLEERKKVIWRSRTGSGPKTGTHHVIYYEDVALNAILFGTLAFLVGDLAAWIFNASFFPLPPIPNPDGGVPDFKSYGLGASLVFHLKSWFELAVHSIFPNAYSDQAWAYRSMGAWLDKRQIDFFGHRYDALNVIVYRFYVAMGAGLAGALWGFSHAVENPVPNEQTTHKRGMRLLVGIEAQTEFARQTAEELKKFGAFAKTAIEDVWYSYYRVLTHTIGIGASGSGKSQFLEPHIKSSIENGLKTIILDPKYEFTQALYDENDPSMAILDPTDARSFVWDFAKDIDSISKIRRFSTSFIPVTEGEGAMWGNAARQLFIGCMIYLRKNFVSDNGAGAFTAKDLGDMLTLLTDKQLYYVMKKYYPAGLDSVGSAHVRENDKGEIEIEMEPNVTSYGIKMNLKGFIDGLNDLGRYWHDPKQRRISLFGFMTDPNYPIKTIFIKPNDDERLMSSGLIRSVLNYMIALLDTPSVTNSPKCRGIFFLDEFQAPGKLAMEDGKPTIDKLLDRGRSKGWGSYLFVQDVLQLENTYKKEEVEQWRAVASNFVLTGTPPGKTAQMVSDIIGKRHIDKLHMSYSNGKISSTNVQEHETATVLPTELSAYLKPVDGKIRFLLLGRGLKDAYVFEKPIVPLEENSPAWIRQPEDGNDLASESRIIKHVEREMTENKIMSSNENVNTKEVYAPPEGYENAPTGLDMLEFDFTNYIQSAFFGDEEGYSKSLEEEEKSFEEKAREAFIEVSRKKAEEESS